MLRFAINAEPPLARLDQEHLMQMQMPMRRNLPVQTGGAVNNGFHMQDVLKGAWLAGEVPRGHVGAVVIMAERHQHFGRSSIHLLPSPGRGLAKR
jgi:hypothetical protein